MVPGAAGGPLATKSAGIGRSHLPLGFQPRAPLSDVYHPNGAQMYAPTLPPSAVLSWYRQFLWLGRQVKGGCVDGPNTPCRG